MTQKADLVGSYNTSLSDSVLHRIVESVVACVPTDEIYLFGSQARNEATPGSDIDLYVITSDDAKSRSDYAVEVYMAIPWLKIPKDILTSPRNVFDRRSSELGAIERTVLAEGVKIYG